MEEIDFPKKKERVKIEVVTHTRFTKKHYALDDNKNKVRTRIGETPVYYDPYISKNKFSGKALEAYNDRMAS